MTARECSQIETTAPSPPETPPHMNLLEVQAWDAAVAAGVVDPGCILVWVVATADAAADGWSHGHGQGDDRRGGSGSSSGLEGAGGGDGGEAESRRHGVVVNRVPWEFLKDGLIEHLSGKLTVPSNRRRRVDYDDDDDDDNESPYSCTGQTSEEEDDEESEVEGGSGEEEGSWCGRVGSRQERILDARELDFIRGILEKKQDIVVLHNRHSGAAAVVAAGRGGRENGGRGINADVISVEEFAAFSRWWAPLMRTLSLMKRDWEATRVHGFVGRFWADRELKRRSPGTFLLRFSERELGALVVSFRASRMLFRKTYVTSVELVRGGNRYISWQIGCKSTRLLHYHILRFV